MTFREAYCKKFGISGKEYSRHIFRRCLHRRARLFTWFLKRLDPEYFYEDFHIIRELGEMEDMSCFKPEVGRFHGRNQRSKSFLRRRLKMRLSGKRLIHFSDILEKELEFKTSPQG